MFTTTCIENKRIFRRNIKILVYFLIFIGLFTVYIETVGNRMMAFELVATCLTTSPLADRRLLLTIRANIDENSC